jgi:SAM-dependent methyltransferase
MRGGVFKRRQPLPEAPTAPPSEWIEASTSGARALTFERTADIAGLESSFMSGSRPAVRGGEYAARGDYHRSPDPSWDYYPTYIAKLEAVRRWLGQLGPGTRVLDAGCGEGVLVDEFASRLAIEGVDQHYSSERVRAGSLMALPYADGSFDRALCLDVLEHLTFEEQPKALAELHRVLTRDGRLLVSVPNLAHLQSRVHFLLQGRLIRTASELKHPGDRPVGEYLQLAERAGFELIARRGIFPTVPILTRLIRRHPQALLPVHRWLSRLLPVPGWCFLNLLTFRKR